MSGRRKPGKHCLKSQGEHLMRSAACICTLLQQAEQRYMLVSRDSSSWPMTSQILVIIYQQSQLGSDMVLCSEYWL